MLLMSLFKKSSACGCSKVTADPRSNNFKPFFVLNMLYSEKSPWTNFALLYKSDIISRL